MLAEDPNDPFLLYGMGMEYVSLGDDAAAVATFERLATEQPGYVPTYLMLGQALHRLGHEADAAGVIRRGIAAARAAGDEHAAGELQALLALVE